ncbi:MAG: hypothetical protein LUI39_05780 [Lachnospiraceae bacterium]|nr:hypothetical protein [Lachnospiraceae bacterium]
MSKQNTKDITTSQLLSLIKKSNEFSEVTETYHDQEDEPLFCHFLYSAMQKHGKTATDVIMESGIERSYFYHILSGQKSPGRNMVLRISLCLSATLTETNQLLRLSRQGVLYPKVKRDAAIIFAIEKKYSMQQTNDLLIQEGELPLYKENRGGMKGHESVVG